MLDFPLALEMIGEEMTMDAHFVIGNIEMIAHEPDEEAKEIDVRVGDRELASVLLAFGPIEHAAGRIRTAALAGEASAFLLILGAQKARSASLPLSRL